MAALGLVLASFAFYVQQCTGRVVRSIVRSNSVDDGISDINLNDKGIHSVTPHITQAVELRSAVPTSKRELESCSKDALNDFNRASSLKGLQRIEQERDALPFAIESFNHVEDHPGWGKNWHNMLFVDPEAKFAFCMIEKNGCSSWGSLLCRRVKGRDCAPEERYMGGLDTFTSERAAQVFADRTATRAVFIRDPVERFLSAFLNKCGQNVVPRPRSCPGIGSGPNNQGGTWPWSTSLNQVVRWVTENLGRPYNDTHWTRQGDHCELKRRLHEYNVISDFSDFNNQAKCVLEIANLTDWNRKDDGDAIIQTQAVNPTIENSERYLVLKKFFTVEAARAVMSLYKADYELFKLPIPVWIDEATGEWIDKPIPSSDKLYRLGNGDHADLDEDEDDIVKLSRRHGFLL